MWYFFVSLQFTCIVKPIYYITRSYGFFRIGRNENPFTGTCFSTRRFTRNTWDFQNGYIWCVPTELHSSFVCFHPLEHHKWTLTTTHPPSRSTTPQRKHEAYSHLLGKIHKARMLGSGPCTFTPSIQTPSKSAHTVRRTSCAGIWQVSVGGRHL